MAKLKMIRHDGIPYILNNMQIISNMLRLLFYFANINLETLRLYSMYFDTTICDFMT